MYIFLSISSFGVVGIYKRSTFSVDKMSIILKKKSIFLPQNVPFFCQKLRTKVVKSQLMCLGFNLLILGKSVFSIYFLFIKSILHILALKLNIFLLLRASIY